MNAARRPNDLFGGVRRFDVRSLAGPVVDVDIRPGTELAREGAVIGTFNVILSGSAQLMRSGRQVGSLGVGDCFGEIDPNCTEPQRHTVVATTPLRLWAFSTFGISRLCDAIPGARERILDSLPGPTAEIHPLPCAADGGLPAAASGPFAKRRRVEHRDRPVVGRDPAELAHQPQRA